MGNGRNEIYVMCAERLEVEHSISETLLRYRNTEITVTAYRCVLAENALQVASWKEYRARPSCAAYTRLFPHMYWCKCNFYFCFCFCFCFRFCQFTFFFFYFFFFLIILSFILFLLSFFSYLSYVLWRPFCPWWTKYANGAVFRSTISITGIFTTQTDHRQQTDILSVYLSVYHRRSVAVIEELQQKKTAACDTEKQLL